MKRAFTLVEVLVSIFIVSFSLAVLFGIVINTLNSREFIEKGADREVSVLFVMNELKREIESLYYCGIKCGFILQEVGYFGRPFDDIAFTTYYGGHKEIEYFFEPEKGSDTAVMFKRVDLKLDGDLKSGGVAVKVVEGIKTFDVRVFGDKGWQERWNQQDGVPKFLEINAEFKYGRDKTRKLRMIVEVRHKDIIGGKGVIITPQR